jgi:ATP-dependent helicase/nuclease subunit A
MFDNSNVIKIISHTELPPAGIKQADLPRPSGRPQMLKAVKQSIRPIPSKISISELKRIYALESAPESAPYAEEETVFLPPEFYAEGSGKKSPMRMGAVLHTAVEHMDLHRQNIDLQPLVSRGLLTREEADAVDMKKLEGFLRSPLAERMRGAEALHKEVPFVIGLSPKEIYGEGAADETILVHGIIDCYFETPKGLVLVDFKNDADYDALPSRYRVQMEIYKKAIEKATGKAVAECLFYSFTKGDVLFV